MQVDTIPAFICFIYIRGPTKEFIWKTFPPHKNILLIYTMIMQIKYSFCFLLFLRWIPTFWAIQSPLIWQIWKGKSCKKIISDMEKPEL